MRRLIINADDLGSGVQRDRGIFQSYSAGIVTSASLLANGPSFATAASGALALDLPLGVHLNLSDGEPLTGAIPGLTTAQGLFPGKAGLRSFLEEDKFDPVCVYHELAAQIERILAAGVVPDHLDAHQHFFLYPAATALVFELARDYSLPALRLAAPVEPVAADPGGELGEEMALYRRLAPGFIAKVRESGLSTPEGLWGMPLLNRLNQQHLISLLRELPAGCWELMVHPGYADGNSHFSGAARQEELLALTSPHVAEEVQRCAITLIDFRELTCGL